MTDLTIGRSADAPIASDDQLKTLAENVDHYDPVFLDNRVAMFRTLHEGGCPIRHSSKHDGFWFVTAWTQVEQALRRVQDFSNEQLVVPRREIPKLIPAGLSHPEHEPIKSALNRLFTAPRTAELSSHLADTASTMMDQCIAKGRFDVVNDLMYPLMGYFTMVHLLGIDPALVTSFTEPIHNMTRRDCPPEKIHGGLRWLDEEMSKVIEAKQYEPGSFLARIAEIEVEGKPFSVDELCNIAINLLIGGMGTTATFVGNAFVFLALNQDLRQQLIEDPDLIPTATREMLRMFSPVQTFARRVVHDTELAGVCLKADDQLLMGYAAANFDPEVFNNPEQADFTRTPNRHLSFGLGTHRCLGEHVAVAVIHAVLKLMIERIPEYELLKEELVSQAQTSSMFGYANVPIRVRT